MNEVTIYKHIKNKFDKVKREINYAWWFAFAWLVEAITIAICINMFPWLMWILILVPLMGVITLLFLSIRKEYLLAKRFPLVYNIWLNSNDFVNKIVSRSDSRAQPDPNTIKIENFGLEHIDGILNQYDDNQKRSNAIYNSITESNLVDEIEFYKKYKRFIKDLGTYRNKV